MTVTRSTLITRAFRRLGARVGTIASGSATRAVLTGLINTTGDDSFIRGDRLLMLDATADTDKERLIDEWNDAEGMAHFLARGTDTDLTGESYIVANFEDYSLTEARDALNVALRETNRTYRHVIPLHPGQRLVPLTPLTWVTGDASVDAVWVSDNPSLLHNPDFALWHDGDASAPDGWTLSGSGALIARISGGIRSSYAATISRVSNDATLYQSIPTAYVQYLTRSTSAPLTPLRGIALVTCNTASRMRVGIYNGSTTTWSSYHSGTDGLPEFLTVSYTPTATDTDLRLVVSVETGDESGTVHYADMVADSQFPDALRDAGEQAYLEYEVPYVTRNVGGVPAVELMSTGPRQLVTYSRRSFAEMDSDADEVDDQFARAIEAGLLCKLLQVSKPNQDRTRLDAILAEEQRIWTRLAANFIDLPVPRPQHRYEIRGA